MTIHPFTVAIPQELLDDLHARLARTRWPDQPEDAGWNMGANLEYIKELVAYWQNGYDWRKHEAALNELPHFKTEIDGLELHFVHVRGKGPNPTPLLLTHGWPDSFYRFHKVISLLTDPEAHGGNAEDAFDLVIPSIPGFGFSAHTALPSSAVADLFAKLMTELGYERFAAAGGDVGSVVTLALSRQHPERLIGIHLTDAGYPTGQEENLSKDEQKFTGFIQDWWFSEGAYAMLHSTKPQSIAFGLNDSPVGLASWIVSFANTGAANHDVEGAFGGRDALLTNIMIYWLTETAASSARSYLMEAQAAWGSSGEDAKPDAKSVPTAFARFPREAPTPRDWVARQANLVRYTEMPRGGHFAALEEPELFAEDVRAFVSSLPR